MSDKILIKLEDNKIIDFYCDPSSVSDGYHTFHELYQHRNLLFLCFLRMYGGWKSRKHVDGSYHKGWFVAGTVVNGQDISYHLPDNLWNMALVPVLEVAQYRDGHNSIDVLDRLTNFLVKQTL